MIKKIIYKEHLVIKMWSNTILASQMVLGVKNPPANAGDIEKWVQSLGWEDLWRKAWQPTPVSILAWRIPQTEEPGGFWSIESQRVSDLSHLANTFMSQISNFASNKPKFTFLHLFAS